MPMTTFKSPGQNIHQALQMKIYYQRIFLYNQLIYDFEFLTLMQEAIVSIRMTVKLILIYSEGVHLLEPILVLKQWHHE